MAPGQIRPPAGSEHDVDYSRDRLDLMLGGKATRSSRLNLFLGIAGGLFLRFAGLALRVSISEREVARRLTIGPC